MKKKNNRKGGIPEVLKVWAMEQKEVIWIGRKGSAKINRRIQSEYMENYIYKGILTQQKQRALQRSMKKGWDGLKET